MENDSLAPLFATKGFLSSATMEETSARNAMILLVGFGGVAVGLVAAAVSMVEVRMGAYDG